MRSIEYDSDRFAEWLRTYTDKAESSIRLYVRTISRFYKIYDEMTEQNLNEFISNGFRKSRSNYLKYALGSYLKYKKKEGLYRNLVKVKVRSRSRSFNYQPKSVILEIIENIDIEKIKDMCDLQYAMCCRAKEVITIKSEYLDYNYHDVIKVDVIGKGDKERSLFLIRKYEEILKKYDKGKGFLFLDDRYNYADEPQLEVGVNTMRQYMYNAIQKSIDRIGIKRFSTHDFRKNGGDFIYSKYGLGVTQDSLGHADPRTTKESYTNPNDNPVIKALRDHQGDYS